MKIGRVSTTRTRRPASSERGKGATTGAFPMALSNQGAGAAPVSGGGALGPVEALLALQEVSNELGQGSRGQHRGEELLDHLDALRLGLLEGRLPLVAIERLSALVSASRDQAEDPRMSAILDEIELRVAVELAKLGR